VACRLGVSRLAGRGFLGGQSGHAEPVAGTIASNSLKTVTPKARSKSSRHRTRRLTMTSKAKGAAKPKNKPASAPISTSFGLLGLVAFIAGTARLTKLTFV